MQKLIFGGGRGDGGILKKEKSLLKSLQKSLSVTGEEGDPVSFLFQRKKTNLNEFHRKGGIRTREGKPSLRPAGKTGRRGEEANFA